MPDKADSLFEAGRQSKKDKMQEHFWWGIIIYMAAFVISTSTIVNYVICQGIQAIGLLIIFSAAFRLIKWNFENDYLQVLFSLYCIWAFFVIARGFAIDAESVKTMLFDADFGLLPYLVPFVLLLPVTLKNFNQLFKVIIILGLLFFLYDILFYKNLMNLSYDDDNTKFTFEFFAKYLSVPSGFILLTYSYHSSRRKIFAFAVLLVCIIFSIIRARRALLFMSLSPMVVSFFLYFLMSKRKMLNFFIAFILSLVLINVGVNIYNKNPNGMFNLLSERIEDDTRSGVEDCFYKDMDSKDWIIGRGMSGQYYCPGIDVGNRTGYRRIIETDYLNIILKGGLISLGLLALIMIPAVVLGFFFSKNLLSKAAACWIFLWLIDLYPANVFAFTLNHLLTWIAVGICYSKTIRNLPDIKLKNYFLSAKWQ